MTNTRKTLSTALVAAIIATGGLFAAPASASAAGMSRLAPVETNAAAATRVHYKGHFKHGPHGYYGAYYGGYPSYSPYYGGCFWKKKKFWTPYGWHWKKVKVCY